MTIIADDRQRSQVGRWTAFVVMPVPIISALLGMNV